MEEIRKLTWFFYGLEISPAKYYFRGIDEPFFIHEKMP
jgi:hypothetical protein